MKKLLAVFILVFFMVVAVGSLMWAIIVWPPLLIVLGICVAPFAIIWAIIELEEN